MPKKLPKGVWTDERGWRYRVMYYSSRYRMYRVWNLEIGGYWWRPPEEWTNRKMSPPALWDRILEPEETSRSRA